MELSLSVIRKSNEQLLGYFGRFRTRLKTVHAIHLKRLILFLKALEKDMASSLGDAQRYEQKTMTVSQFVDSMGEKVNGINFLEIQDYLLKSKVRPTLQTRDYANFKPCRLQGR